MPTIKFNNKNLEVFTRDEADKSVVGEIFKYREYRAAEDIIKEAKDVIIDIGAHAGFFVLYCRALNPEIKILAVEPERENVKQLGKHLQENNIENVELVEAAVAGEAGERNLFTSVDSHNHRLNLIKEDLKRGPSIKVKAVTLSDLIQPFEFIDLIKMDIEGGEYEVFDNLSEEAFAKVKNIILEYHNYWGRNYKEVEVKLRTFGFSVQIFPSQFDQHLGFLLAKNKRIK